MIKKMLILMGVLCSALAFVKATSQPRWDASLDFAVIERQLAAEDVVAEVTMQEHLKSIGHQSDFEGKVFFLTLKNGLQAVFKPYAPADYPDAYAELAAYKASRYMGLRLVPPVVLRKIKGKFGSLQFYVTPSIDALNLQTFGDALNLMRPQDQHNIKVFYFLFGQWDYGPHNIILQQNGGRMYPALIDNTGIKHHQKWRLNQHPFVRVGYFENLNTNDWWGVPFPFDKTQVVEPDMAQIKKRFGATLSPRFHKKLSQGKKPIHYILWHNSFWRQFHQG